MRIINLREVGLCRINHVAPEAALRVRRKRIEITLGGNTLHKKSFRGLCAHCLNGILRW